MLRKILITALIISVSPNGFARSKSFDSKEAAIEAVKSDVLRQVDEKLLSRIQEKLKSGERIKPEFKKGMKESDQFLCQKSKIADLYKKGKVGKKSSQLEEVLNKLKDKGVRPSDFTFTNLRAGKVEIEDTEGDVIYTFPISFEAHTLTPSIGNHAKYIVSFYYTGKLKKKKEYPIVDGKKNKKAEKVIVGYAIRKSAEFRNSKVVATSMFDSESAYMKKNAADKIAAWYAGLPVNLDAKYAKYVNSSKGIKSVNENLHGIEIKQNGKTFTAIGWPIEIDFVPEIDPTSRHLYTNPIATISITPSFSVVFGDDLKTIVSENIVTGYTEKVKEATTDSAKVLRLESAHNAVDNFSDVLSGYVDDKNKESREKVMAMFVDSKNDEVAVSHRSKFNNKERINRRKAGQYLQLLSGNNLAFETVEYLDSNKTTLLNAEHPELGLSYDPNLYTVMFDVIQKYDGNNYKDKTRKIIVMKNQDDNSYLIEAIIVVPNSTTIVE